MFGSMAGNLMGILYFLLFQFMGIIIASLFLKKEKWGFTLLAGSVLGSFSLQWIPVLFAFSLVSVKQPTFWLWQPWLL